MNETDNLKDEVKRLKGLLNVSEKYNKVIDIDNEKLQKDLASCQKAYKNLQNVTRLNTVKKRLEAMIVEHKFNSENGLVLRDRLISEGKAEAYENCTKLINIYCESES